MNEFDRSGNDFVTTFLGGLIGVPVILAIIVCLL